MAFPQDDRAWAETAAFLAARLGPADRLAAPDPFRFVIPRALRPAQLAAEPPEALDWVVVHKGELEAMPRPFLEALPAAAVPVFANEVFVAFARVPPADLADLTETDHVRALAAGIAALPPLPVPAGFPRRSVRLLPAGAESPPGPALVPPAPPLPGREGAPPPRRAWSAAPEAPPAPARERALQAEIEAWVADVLSPAAGLRLLDLGCGAGRLAPLLPGAAFVAGVDLDAPALARARARHAALPGFGFARMDAARLGFAAASFDAVLMLDLFEWLPDPAAALAEAARVLGAGGRLLVTAPNAGAPPLRALRRLALPVPSGAVSARGLAGMLRAAGLVPEREEGLMFPLGWGLASGAGPAAALEEDPDFVETARALGRRAGPEHALLLAMVARKA